MLLGSATAEELVISGELQIEGDGTKLAALFGLLDEPDPNFNIVTP
jgi:alkyl sulfatase BDS1-like metallo-beta-lactamase superfamily hydrolase